MNIFLKVVISFLLLVVASSGKAMNQAPACVGKEKAEEAKTELSEEKALEEINALRGVDGCEMELVVEAVADIIDSWTVPGDCAQGTRFEASAKPKVPIYKYIYDAFKALNDAFDRRVEKINEYNSTRKQTLEKKYLMTQLLFLSVVSIPENIGMNRTLRPS